MFTHNGRGAAARLTGDDSGFTIVEILMATVILLIAFSGVMSLMIANTYMNVRAKEKASLTNEANSYVERVRQMKYEDIGTSASIPPGLLVPYTITTNGFVITVTPAVSALTDSTIINTPVALKKLAVVLSARRVGTVSPLMSYHAETIIKKTDSGVNSAAQLPTVDPTASSPATGSVVSGHAVPVGAVASANGSGVTLTAMNFYVGVDSLRFLRDQSNVFAQWSLNSATYTSPAFFWDTLSVDESGTALSPDGEQTLMFEVWDSNGRQSTVLLPVIVDNSPPMWPAAGWMTATAVSAASMNLAWSPAIDGNTLPDHYAVQVDKDNGAGIWSSLGSTNFPGTTGTYASAAFSRYRFTVKAVGPPALSRESTGTATTTGISRPSISGSQWRNATPDSKNITTYVKINISAPNFVYSAVTNTLYKSTSASMAGASPVGSSFTDWAPAAQFLVGTVSGNGWPPAIQYYYQVKTVLTPAGGSPQTFYSQVVGPNGTSGAALTNLTTVGW